MLTVLLDKQLKTISNKTIKASEKTEAFFCRFLYLPSHICHLILIMAEEKIRVLHRVGWPESGSLRLFKLASSHAIVKINTFKKYDPSTDRRTIDRQLFVSHLREQDIAAKLENNYIELLKSKGFQK